MTYIQYMAYNFLYEKQFALFFEKIEWEEIDGSDGGSDDIH